MLLPRETVGLITKRLCHYTLWMTAKDNLQAMKLYDSVAIQTKWVTYDATID